MNILAPWLWYTTGRTVDSTSSSRHCSIARYRPTIVLIAAAWPSQRSQHMRRKPYIGSESRFLPTPLAFDFNAPVRGVPVGILQWSLVWWKKLEWYGYPTVKKFRKYSYSFSQNVRTYNGQTDTAWRHRPNLCIALRGKNGTHRPVTFNRLNNEIKCLFSCEIRSWRSSFRQFGYVK